MISRRMKIVVVAAALGAGAGSATAAQVPPCCTITAITTATGVVSGKVTATNETFQFKASDARTLASLKVGQSIYANFTTHQVSIDGRHTCCTVTSGPAPTRATVTPPLAAGKQVVSRVVAISVDPAVTGGRELHGTIVVAPAAGTQPQSMLRVVLSTSSPQLVQLAGGGYVGIPAGASVAHFTLVPQPVLRRTVVTISASLNGATRTDTFTIVPPALTSVTVTPKTLASGDSATATATFSGPPAAANAVIAAIASSNPAVVHVPSAVTLPPDRTAVQFTVVAAAAGQSTPVEIKATYGTTRQGTPRAASAAVTVSPVSLRADGECFSPCLPLAAITAKLPVAAPAGGLQLFFSSNSLSFPQGDAITIPAGVDSGVIAVSIEGRQVTGFPAVTLPVAVSYGGHLFHGAGLTVWPEGKPDLVVWKVTLSDRFANDITTSGPTDGQPFTMCASVSQVGPHPDDADEVWLTEPAGPSALQVSYLDNQGIGHEFSLPTVFQANGGYAYAVPVCATLPGLADVNDYLTVTLTADVNNEVKEKNEGNNRTQFRTTRKH